MNDIVSANVQLRINPIATSVSLTKKFSLTYG